MRDESVSLMNDVWLLVLRLSRTLSASTLQSLWTAGSRLTGSPLKARARDRSSHGLPSPKAGFRGRKLTDRHKKLASEGGMGECCSLLLMFINTLQSSGACE